MTYGERFHFDRPPVWSVEVGAVFDVPVTLTSGHLGLFWDRLGVARYPLVEEYNARPVEVESFPRGSEFPNLDIAFADRPRPLLIVFSDPVRNLRVALQAGRIQVRWQRVSAADSYPRFEVPRDQFSETITLWAEFLASHGMGDLRVRQGEVAYHNHIPRTEGWTTVSELAALVKVAKPASERLGDLEDFHYADSYEVEAGGHKGRLRTTLFSGELEPEEHDATLSVAIRGPASTENIVDYLNFGHAAATAAFVDVTTADAHKLWGRRDSE
jgi:hypothetical protein